MEPIKIVLIDDHSLVRDGIKSILSDQHDLEVVGEASSGLDGMALIDDLQPDLAIVDIRMPKMTGIEMIKQMATKGSSTKYLMLSMHDTEEYVLDSVRSGAFGYILKDSEREEFLKAIHQVNNGQKYFSADISQTVVNSYLDLLKGAGSPKEEKRATGVTNSVLTKRENEILHLALQGLSNKEIAQKLEKSQRTIETHRFNLMKKLGTRNVAELHIKAKELGIY